MWPRVLGPSFVFFEAFVFFCFCVCVCVFFLFGGGGRGGEVIFDLLLPPGLAERFVLPDVFIFQH